MSEAMNWELIARHYDRKTDAELNYLVAEDKRIVHHHSGVFPPGTRVEELTAGRSQEELRALVGQSETRLTRLGGELLVRHGVTPASRGLDCGCGRGGSSFLLAREHGYRMFGITISPYQYEFAQARRRELGLEERTDFSLRNVFELTTPTEMDFVWACESTEYMPDRKRLFETWNGVLRPGGQVLIFVLCSVPELFTTTSYARAAIEHIDRHYETRIGPLSEYLESALRTGFGVADLVDLRNEVLPYWRLRQALEGAPGTEAPIIDGLERGYLKFQALLFRKDRPAEERAPRPTLLQSPPRTTATPGVWSQEASQP